MPTRTNKNLSKAVLIFAFLLLTGLALSGCSGITEPDPTIIPIEIQPTETSPAAKVEIFERYSVVGIARGSFLSVYKDPSADSPIVEQIPSFGTDIKPTGEVHLEGNSSWLLIDHKQTAGWVDLEFLAEQHGALPIDLIILGQQVLESLKTAQYSQLIPLIHPESCLRFSPYQYLNTDNRIICPSDLDIYTSSSEPFAWGQYDGTGKPIDLTFSEYHQEFVYDQDYQKPSVVGFNVEVSPGNSINNIQEIYPDGIMIEYHFPGIDPQYGGMDWRSLRLVFIPDNDQWYLVAIIHGEWTI